MTNVTMYCHHHRISCVLIWNYLPELRELEVKRDAFEIPNEESITAYYKIRQQLKRLGNDMLVSIWLLCCQKFVRALLKGKSVWFFLFSFFSEFYSPTQVLSAIYAAWKIDSGKNKCRIGHELWDIVFYIYKPVC